LHGFGATKGGESHLVVAEAGGVEVADEEQGGGFDLGEMSCGEVGAAASRDDGIDFAAKFCGGEEGCSGTGAGPKVANAQA
jgi:hypothetical protein